mmetsp:Transcript_5319/g.9230  ORF Transcript_5319/g.9230 Transcript_5319/m.9230 type:complete len:273 (-) Transcript_5319:84-902(-)
MTSHKSKFMQSKKIHRLLLLPLQRPRCSGRSRRPCSHHRCFSSEKYIEQWQQQTVKPASFYEEHANGQPRKYFYSIDLQGRIFLEETVPKNLATSIKNEAFLDFFCSRIQELTPQDYAFLRGDHLAHDYPFVSLCGAERNYIRPADAVIVFHSFLPQNAELVFGASLVQPFQPHQLAISQRTGRLYHKLHHSLPSSTHLEKQRNKNNLPSYFGLIRSSVAVTLSERMEADPKADETASSGMTYVDKDKDHMYPIPWLPSDAEPGSWAMPNSD